MFKVPDWGSDIPKSNVDFSKKINQNRKVKNENAKSSHMPANNPQKQNKQGIKGSRDTFKKKKPKNRKLQNAFINETHSGSGNNIKKMRTTEMKNKITLKAKKNIKNKSEHHKNEDKQTISMGEVTKTTKTKLSKPKSNKHKMQAKVTNGNVSITPNKSPKKRKRNEITHSNDTENEENNAVVVKPKKMRFNNSETVETGPVGIKKKNTSKKDRIRKLLETNNRTSINVKGDKLRERMLERLKAAQFRYLNEKLYTSSGNEAQEIFQSDPGAFKTYHQGYQQQVKKWPVNPLDVIVKKIQKLPKTTIIADMGCGEAALSKKVQHKVHSFDLVSSAPGVVACDMAHTPLLAESVDVAVYCLALMGTELTQYLVEANRVLRQGGQLLIAEVESRFDNVETFTNDVERLGFKLKNVDKEQSVFFFLHFQKIRDPPLKKNKLPSLKLKPCLYKKR